MKFIGGRITITSAATRIQLTSHASIDANMKLIWFSCNADPDNTGSGFIGNSDVSNAIGVTLVKTATPTVLPLRQIDKKGSIDPSTVWFDADNNGDKIEFLALFE